MGQTTFGNWLRGDSLPPNARIPLLANCLGIPVDDLRGVIAADRSARAKAQEAETQAMPTPEAT